MDIIKELKEIYKLNSSEELFGIYEQPDDTCPMIDEIKKIVNNANSTNSYIIKNSHKYSSIDDIVSEVENDIDIIDIELIRKNCMNLRDRGQGRKDLAKDMFADMTKEQREKYVSKFIS